MYGDETLRQAADQSDTVVRQLNTTGDLPLPVVLQPVLTESVAIHRKVLEAQRGPEVHRRDHVDAHVLAREDVDRRARARSQKPMLHLHTQANVALPWAEIDMDFMNLNQAAHGDREFAFIVLTACGRRARRWQATVRSAGAVADRGVVPAAGLARDPGRRSSLASATTCATSRDRWRQGRGTDAVRCVGQQYGVNDLAAAVISVADAEVDVLAGEYEDEYAGDAGAALKRRPPRSAPRRRRASSSASGRSSTPAVSGVHHELRRPGRAAAATRARGSG